MEVAAGSESTRKVDELVRQVKLLSSPERKRFKDLTGYIGPLPPVPDIPINSEPDIPDALSQCWNFDRETGEPNYEDLKTWIRVMPAHFVTESAFHRNSHCTADTKVLSDFKEGMESVKETFVVVCGDGTKNNDAHKEAMLIRRLIGYEIKQVVLQKRTSSGYIITLIFKKTRIPLIPYPGAVPAIYFEKEVSKVVNAVQLVKLRHMNTKELYEFWKEDCKYAVFGPGTAWCWDSQCKLQNKLTSSSVVEFGQEKKIICTKRFTCKVKIGCTYLAHCQICKDNGESAYCVGSTFSSDFHNRVNKYLLSNDNSAYNHIEITLDEGKAIVSAVPPIDPNQVRRHLRFHCNFEHGVNSKEGFRITILGWENDKNNLLIAEQTNKLKFGSMRYSGFGRGGLNKPPNA